MFLSMRSHLEGPTVSGYDHPEPHSITCPVKEENNINLCNK